MSLLIRTANFRHTSPMRRNWFISNAKFISGLVIGLVLAGGTAYSANLFNTPETGYLLCINKKTKAVTYPATQKCPTGTNRLVLGAKGAQGEIGITGEQGLQGIQGLQGMQGKDGKDGINGLPGSPGGSGAPGANGQPGLFKVYDRNGDLVGSLLGSSSGGTSLDVLTPGGFLKQYDVNGTASRSGMDVWFLDSNCTGTAYVETRNLYRSLGDGNIDFNQRMYSSTNPIIFLKGLPTFEQSNNFSVDKVFVPVAESRTATTIYTPTDYFSGSANTLGCFAYPASDPGGRFGVITNFDVTELQPFTGDLRIRFAGPLVIR